MPVKKSDVIIIDKNFEPKNVEDILLKYRAQIIEDLREQLRIADRDTPGVLAQSVDGKVEQQSDSLILKISMEDYWKYVDGGRRKGAKQPPIEAIMKFIYNRGIKVKTKAISKGLKSKKIKKTLKKINKEKAVKSLAFVIARGIKRKGIKPTNFFKNVINDNLRNEMQTEISKALQIDIELLFTA